MCMCAYLVIVVVQVRISALQLHHLYAGHPVFLLLSHQITVGVSDPPVTPSTSRSTTEHRERDREREQNETDRNLSKL